MHLIVTGILLIAVAVLLGFTDVVALVALGGLLYWLGGLMILVGIVLAIVHLVRGPSPNAPRRGMPR